jgi:hypothetical protein
MNTIPQDKLTHIASQTGNLVELVNDGIGWADTFLSNENKVETKYDVKKYRRTLKKIKAVVDKKPVIALFGASQVGKSYMANNLLYNKDNKLMIYNHQGKIDANNIYDKQELDFLVYLNPEGGGKEATAVVTRFTSDRESDSNKLPVKVKLFDVKDIVNILCDTYGSEFKEENVLANKEKIIEHIKVIKTFIIQTPQEILSDDDIYEVKEYLERYWDKQGYFLESLKEAGFWDFLADNIKYIPQDKWGKVLEILWNKHIEITDVFETILTSLSKLKFSKVAHISFEAIVRTSSKSIVNVATLLQDFYNDSTFFQIQLEDGQITQIAAGKLCLLAIEITLSVSNGTIENRNFIENVDIIDFPGARSRFELSELSQENIANMLLRGKVSYLFNSYSTNYQTNTLAYCVKTVKTDVPQMPSLIENWINYNLGSTLEKRTSNLESLPIPPLFVIFTWWNTQLFAERATNEDPTERVESQFRTLVKQEIMTDKKWPNQWMNKNGITAKFQNYYLLRDFERSGGTFNQNKEFVEYTTDLYDENKKLLLYENNNFFAETKQLEYNSAYFDKFKEFHNSSQGLFENPEKSFLEASVPGKDGSELIIEKLKPVSSNKVSVPIYLNVLNDAVAKLNKELGKHYHSSDSEESLRKSAQDATNIQFKMDIVFGLEAYYFGRFIEHLTLTESEIVSFYHDLLVNRVMVEKKDTSAYVLLRTRNNNLDATKTFDENLTILMNNYHLGSLEETKKRFEEGENIDLKELFYGGKTNLKENSLVLAEAAREYWFDTKLNTDKFQLFIDKGLEKGMLIKLFDNLKVSYDKKVKMTGRIASQVRHFVDVEKRIDKAEDMVAHITAGLINEFITSFGWSFYSEEDKIKLTEANKNSHLRLSIPNDKELFQALERINEPNNERMSVEYLLDYMNDLASNLNKIPIDEKAIEHVPMIKNYKRWSELMKISFIANNDIPTYNIEANKKLGTILEKIKEYHFAL